MRIISWNMGCSFPGRYRRSHADAWRYLFGLQPDVVFVQEALRKAAPAVSLGTTVWSANRGQESATAVLVRSGAAVTPLEVRARASYVAAATVRCSIGPLLFASVHVGPGDYKENRRVVVQKLRKIIDNPEVRTLSDHGPLRLDLAIDLDL